jgi:hypothetical protein
MKEMPADSSKSKVQPWAVIASILVAGVLLSWPILDLMAKRVGVPASFPKVTPSTQIESETSMVDVWKVYTNQALGVSFAYPPDWSGPNFATLSTKSRVTFDDGKEIPGGISKFELTRGGAYDQDLGKELNWEEVVNQRALAPRVEANFFRLINWQGNRFVYHAHGVGYYITEIYLAKHRSSTDVLTIIYRHDVTDSKPDEMMPKDLYRILASLKLLDKELEKIGWLTARLEKLGLEFSYPPQFLIEKKEESIRVSSPSVGCVTSPIPERRERIEASEIDLDFTFHSGESYEEIWRRVFGFEFGPVDGQREIDGREAYFFYQGAEATFGRQALLVKLSPTTALEINNYTPVLVYECETPLNQYPGVAQKILDTIQFTKEGDW